MTAIAGIWSFDGAISVSASCQSMLQALALYGKDARAQFNGSCCSLGLCLLRSLPEDDYDSQPLSVADEVALVADVRLDNRKELAADLGLSSEEVLVTADSGILKAAWQRWGEQCVDHLAGAFSFAVWNQRQQRLFLARDPVGERPLFYASRSQSFAFASMPKGLHALPHVGAEIDEDYVARYLSLANMPNERTAFMGMQRLPAGCTISVEPGKISVSRYWRTDSLAPLRLRSTEDYLALFREKFDRAVRARLRTRGAIGAQLSGGLDSASVAATAAGLLAAEGREITCYTAIPRADFTARKSSGHFEHEGEAAAEVAARYPNMRHVLVDSSATSFLDILDRNNHLYDHPCFGPNNEVWSNAIMDQAQASGISLVLNGGSGNSTLSYEGLPALSAWFRSGHWAKLAWFAWQLVHSGSVSTRLVLRHAVWPSLPMWLRRMTDPHLRGFSLDYSMLRPEIARRLDLERIARSHLGWTSSDGRTFLRTLLAYGDLADTTIAYQGGWGIDFRDPTFDREIVEFCLSVPLEEFLRGGELRSLARRAMAGRLPASTLQRRARGLQSADWHHNMGLVRGRMLLELTRLRTSPLASRLLDLERMQSLIQTWPTEGFDRPEVMRSYHIALTRGFSVGRFLMRYDGSASQGFSDTRRSVSND